MTKTEINELKQMYRAIISNLQTQVIISRIYCSARYFDFVTGKAVKYSDK